MRNKIIHSTRVHASHFDNLKKKAAAENLKRRKVALSSVGDGATKELSWDSIGAKSVITMGDFDSTKFGLSADGKIVPITGDNSSVIEQRLSSDIISLDIRRLGDQIVYQADGKGNSVPGQKSIEFAPGDINDNLLPDEPVVINMRTADGESDATTEIRPSGEVTVYTGKPNDVLPEDIPMTAVTIKMDDDVKETYFDTPHLRIRCRLDDEVVLQYEVSGKPQAAAIPAMTDVDHPYVELGVGSLGIFTPLATGPVVALRTIDGNSGAYVQFNKDGSVKMYVPAATNFANDDFKTTCTYENILFEEVITQTAVGAGVGIIQVSKADNTIIFDILTQAGSSVPANGSKIMINAGVLEKELYPDKDLYLALPTETNTYGLFACYSKDGSVTFYNKTSAAITTVNATNPVSTSHINRVDSAHDAHEQTLENDKIICNLRKDFNNIVAEVTPKQIATVPTRQTIELFPEGSIDHEFIPESGEQITVELSTNNHTDSDAFVSVLDNGALALTYGNNAIDLGETYANTYIDLESSDTVLAEVTLEGGYIELTAHKQGDVINYMCCAIQEDIPAGYEEFRTGSLPKELCPDVPVLIQLPVKDPSDSTSIPCYVGIIQDGSVATTRGVGVDTEIYMAASTEKASDPSVETVVRKGENVTITAKKSDETIVYEVVPFNATVPAGQTYELTGGNVLPPQFRPNIPMNCWIPNIGGIDASGSHVFFKPTGEVSLYSDGTQLITGKTQTVTEVNQDEDNPYSYSNDYTIAITQTGQTSVYEGKGGSPRVGVDYMTLHFDKVGAVIGHICTPAVLPDTYSPIANTHGAWVKLADNFLDARYLPRAGEPMVTRLLTKPAGATTSTPYEGKAMIKIDHEGVLSIRTNGDVLGDSPNQVAYVDAITQDLVEKEYDLSSYLSTTTEAPEGIGDWLKATFRKVKDTVVGFLKGQGTLTANILNQTLQVEFAPDKGFRAEINPGKDKGKGSFTVDPTGKFSINVGTAIHFEGGGSPTAYSRTAMPLLGKCFTLPYIKYGDGDIFNDVVTLGLQGKHKTHVLFGEGHMYYSDEHVSVHGVKHIISTRTVRTHVQPEGFMDFLSNVGSFITSNIDLRAVGSSILQGGASLVTGLISGKGFGDSVSGALKEVMSGSFSNYIKPDGFIGTAMGTMFGGSQGGSGVLGGVMKMLPSGGAEVIGKGLDFLGAKFPFAGSFINKAKGFLGEPESEAMYAKLSKPHSQQSLKGEMNLDIVRYGMDVTYFFSSTNKGKITPGQYEMKGIIKESLRPDFTLIDYINPYAFVTIGTDGKCVVNVNNAFEIGDASYVVRTAKLYRPYGWNFAELAKQAKPKRKYNKRS